MGERLLVGEAARLLPFLRRRLPGWKRGTLEQCLRDGRVRVNGAVVSRNELVAAGDEVLVVERDAGDAPRSVPAGIVILHEDEDLVAIDKPAGLLSVSTERGSERTALALVREALSRRGESAALWPVHRLDRETSGVLLFACSREAQQAVQAAWTRAQKLYLALVEGVPEPPSGVIDQPLSEDRDLFVRVGRGRDAKESRTRYAMREVLGERALLEVELDTGRRHQIRAHLAWLGHPVVGDERYGTAGGRLGLHALRLVVPHPFDGQPLTLEAPPPKGFVELLR